MLVNSRCLAARPTAASVTCNTDTRQQLLSCMLKLWQPAHIQHDPEKHLAAAVCVVSLLQEEVVVVASGEVVVVVATVLDAEVVVEVVVVHIRYATNKLHKLA